MRLAVLFLGILLAGCSGNRPPESAQAPPQPAKILHFYASPPVVARGDHVTLCYGVENARAVRLEPEIEPLRPSPNRCIHFSPQKSGGFKLIATGADGKEVAETLELRVEARRAAASTPEQAPKAGEMILLFLASPTETAAGQPVMLCYGVEGAQSVRLEPGGRALDPVPRRCLAINPTRTTTYTLLAAGEGNKSERREVTVRVK